MVDVRGRGWWVAVLLILAGGAATASALGPPRRAALPDVDRAAFVQQLLALRDVDLQTLELPPWSSGTGGTVAVRLGGQDCTLALEPHAVRAPGYQLLVETADGRLAGVTPGPAATYRGTALEWPGSVVAASRRPDGLHARIRMPSGQMFWIQPTARQAPGGPPSEHAVYRGDDVISSAGACTDDLPPAPADALARAVASATPCDGELCVAELACDADAAFVDQWGVLGAEARIHDVINLTNIQYEQDLGVTHQITAVVLRDPTTDPYSSTAGAELLAEVRAHWNTHHIALAADAVQLFTGRDLDGSIIGTAYVGTLCSDAAFSVVQSDCCGSLGCAADLSAHELAHLWSAGHCYCTNYTMNPVIYCAQRFHPEVTVPPMAAFRDGASCLHALSGCSSDAECADGLICNGNEMCSAGQCVSGAALDCDDGIDCTLDVCDEASLACDHQPRHADCDNGQFCDGLETCDPVAGCIAGQAPCGSGACLETTATCVDCLSATDCDDGIDCTIDECLDGACSSRVDASACDNGLFCDGVETCTPSQGCVAGPAPCADAPCDEATGMCLECLFDEDCGDGAYCNGAERCDAGACLAGEPPCAPALCDESLALCADGCGDGACSGAEDCENCPVDCLPVRASGCGNDVCEPYAGEDCETCPDDCRGVQRGNPGRRYCCGGGDYAVSCSDLRCTVSGWQCAEVELEPSCCGDDVCAVLEACACVTDCGVPGADEFDCTDGVDNDCDGAVDCADPDCAGLPECFTPCSSVRPEVGPRCSDGIDNDCDGLTDSADDDCQ